jgi:hypothetical protein
MARHGALALALLLTACGGEGSMDVVPAPAASTSYGGSTGAGASHPGTGGKPAGHGGTGPNGGTSGSSAGGASGSAGSGGEGGMAPTIRTVETRSPFGNLSPKNLMWDGDFELSGPFVQQYAWIRVETGADAPDVQVGLGCHSGLKCARVAAGKSIAGYAVAPSTPETRVRVHARIPEGKTCKDVSVQMATCYSSVHTGVAVPAKDLAPDASRYCTYGGDLPTPTEAPCLVVNNKAGAEILVDDVFFGAPDDLSEKKVAAGAPTAEEAAIVLDAQEALRKHRDDPKPPRRPPVTSLGRGLRGAR